MLFKLLGIKKIEGGWFIAFIVIFVVAVMLFLQHCGKQKEDPVISQAQLDSAHNAIRAIETKRFMERLFHEEESRRLQERSDSLQKEVVKSETKIKNLIKDGNTYRKQLDFYASITDTGMIDVHPSYVSYCDSMADLSYKWETEFTQYKKETSYLVYSLNDQLDLKSKEIESQKSYGQQLSEQNAWLTKGITEISNKNKPRNRVFFGAAVAGTQVNPLFGFGLGVGFMNKKEQYVSTDALMIRGGELMFQVSGKFKISFK